MSCTFAKCYIFLCCSYSLNTSTCRAKILVKYFGEEFGPDRCDMYFSTSSMSPIQIKDVLLAISCEAVFTIANIFLYLFFTFDLRCDVCINGPPQMHDFKEEAIVFMNVLQGRSVSIQCKSGDHILF